MARTTTFTNDFHNTEATVRGGVGDTVSKAVYDRVCRDLCASDCQCGVFRGSKYKLVPADAWGERYLIVRP